MCKNSYHKYDIYVAPKSEYATDEVLKVSIDGDDEHTSIVVVEIATHLRKIYSDEFKVIVIKETQTGSTTRKQIKNWDLLKDKNEA